MTITFADGAREQMFMALANPGPEPSWCLVIATPNFQVSGSIYGA